MFQILLILDIIVAFVLTIGGEILRFKAPLDDTHSLGFKTGRALASEEAWIFANRMCGGIWMTGGFIQLFSVMFACSVFAITGETAGTVTAAVILILSAVLFIGSIIATETALKHRFPDDSRR